MKDIISDQKSFHIREEILATRTKWVQTGAVRWHKEILVEDKTITVPVRRVELVIEKDFIAMETPGQSVHTEIVRIPIREERVNIHKQTFDLEQVNIYKRCYQEGKTIDIVLNKEVMAIRTSGNPIVEINEH